MPRTLQRLFGMLLVSLSLVANLQAQTPETGKPKQPLAMIDGQAINDDDLLPYVQAQLRPLREQEYQIKKKALENLINQRLLEAAAKKKNLSTEKLLEQEVDSKVAEPTDAELNTIYTMQKDQINRPFEEVKVQLQQNLKRAKIQQGRQDYYQGLREQAEISVLLGPPRAEVGIDPARVRGNPKARVMIVEFTDFQCPYCGEAEATLKSVLAKHEGVVALAFRDLPLTQIHPQAMMGDGRDKLTGVARLGSWQGRNTLHITRERMP